MTRSARCRSDDGIVHPLLGRQLASWGYDRDYGELVDTGPVTPPPAPEPHSWTRLGLADDAIRVLNGLREAVPLLLALSANSPFSHGRDTGFASTRTTIFQAFPRTGTPRRFESYDELWRWSVEDLEGFWAAVWTVTWV